MESKDGHFWQSKPFGDGYDPRSTRVRRAIPIVRHPKPLHVDERGLVFGYPATADEREPEIVHVKTAIDRQDLRFNLLFWDRLNIASAVDAGLTIEEQILVREGVLDNTRFADVGTLPNLHEASMLDAPLHALEPLMEREPGRWALGRADYALSPSIGAVDTVPGTLFTLHEMVPVPRLEVPIEEILVFKQKRKAELSAYRAQLEGIAFRIQAAGDLRPSVTFYEADQLQRALRDLHLVVGESKMTTFLGSLGQYLNYDFGAAAAAAAAGTAAGGGDVWSMALAGLGGESRSPRATW